MLQWMEQQAQAEERAMGVTWKDKYLEAEEDEKVRTLLLIGSSWTCFIGQWF